MSIREEIQDAVARLGIAPPAFVEVPVAEARRLLDTFLGRFTAGVDGRWWWEHFSLPYSTVHFQDGKGFTRISELVPDVDERIWFVAEDADLPFFPVYDATPGTIRDEGCNVLEKTDDSEYGKFGWVMDPEGNKVELWQPPAGQ
jgi:hypothetical protein